MAEKNPQNFMIEHLLRDLYGVDSPAVKYIVNVKKIFKLHHTYHISKWKFEIKLLKADE